MGLLDDAIKEHLELKRRRGADPGEVERLEREALGPVRRGPQPAEEAFAEPEVADQHLAEPTPYDEQEPTLYDEQADEAYAEPPELEHEPAFADQQAHEPFPEDESEQGWSHEPAEGWADEPVAHEDHPTEAHAGPPVPAAPEPEAPAPEEQPGEETIEYDVEAEELQRRDPQDDVLEETPEFLQDTPDHDRLWFEQRPPKDFDFDK